MCNEKAKQWRRSLSLLGAAAYALVLATTATQPESAFAGGPVAESPRVHAARSLGDLEKAFWACDYAATTRGVLSTPVEICGAVTEDFKRVRFAGDFEALLKWWQENKAMAHRDLARDVRPAALGSGAR
jgi:hypothetical protein